MQDKYEIDLTSQKDHTRIYMINNGTIKGIAVKDTDLSYDEIVEFIEWYLRIKFVEKEMNNKTEQ